jgi:hypothetical protein
MIQLQPETLGNKTSNCSALSFIFCIMALETEIFNICEKYLASCRRVKATTLKHTKIFAFLLRSKQRLYCMSLTKNIISFSKN